MRAKPKTIRIPHQQISDSKTISSVQEQIFKENGLDIHKDEVLTMDDDMKRGERILGVKTTLYFRPPSREYLENYDKIEWGGGDEKVCTHEICGEKSLCKSCSCK